MFKGIGQTKAMKDPVLELSDGVKTYADKPEDHDRVSSSQGLVGVRIYKWAIVPNKTGEYKLGKIKLNYFNTESGKYEDLIADLGVINVAKGAHAQIQSNDVGPAQTQTTDVVSEKVKYTGKAIVEAKTPANVLSSRALTDISDYIYGCRFLVILGLILLVSISTITCLVIKSTLLKERIEQKHILISRKNRFRKNF